jgi:DNA-binding transcriptional regulator YiaG
MDGLALMSDGYHYTGCGLDYVYLLNGYTLHETEHGPGVSIEDARRLHERVALDIIGDPHPLRGQEVRFLRGMMKISQEGLARVLRQRRGSVARWEAEPNKTIPGAADSALRMFYALKAGGHAMAVKVVELLQEIDDLEHATGKARELQLRNDSGWMKAAA